MLLELSAKGFSVPFSNELKPADTSQSFNIFLKPITS